MLDSVVEDGPDIAPPVKASSAFNKMFNVGAAIDCLKAMYKTKCGG
jgi:hypothetical protein